MRSRAQIQKHPIHPMLIPFPIAFLIGTLIADLVANFGSSPPAALIGYWLGIAGILTGLLAAVPGMIDYAETVPPASSAKRYATIHMLLNVTVLVLFAVAWFLKPAQDAMPSPASLILELAGSAILGVAGAIGGELAYRFQIGVEHKYANDGEWKELGIEELHGNSVAVASPDELEVGQMKLVHVNDRRIVLARSETGYVAFDDRCTHEGGPLSDGVLARDCVQCPWHGSQFNVNTGQVKAGPADRPVVTYDVVVRGDRVEIVFREHEFEKVA